MRRLHTLLLGLSPSLSGLALVLLLDALTLLARGAPLRSLLYAALLFALIGPPLALLLWGLAALAGGAARLTARLLRRPSPGGALGPAILAGLAATAILHPVHLLFARAPLGAYLSTGYALFVTLSIALWLGRRYEAVGPGVTAPRLWLLLGPLLGATVALHLVNALLYANLYMSLHYTLTGMSVATATAAGLILARARPEARRWALIGAAGIGLMGLGALYQPAVTRAHVFFSGVELQHLARLVEWTLDVDRDGVSGSLGGGDCDDRDPLVSPLAFEIPKNGKDDNCRRGDASGRLPPSLRPSAKPAPASLEAWRREHGRLNVLVIFLDTLRADEVGAYGAEEASTPHIDAFFARATRFTQARTTAPRTPHAWMSIIRARFNGRNLKCRSKLRNPTRGSLVYRLRTMGYEAVAHFVGRSWKKFHLAGGWTKLHQHGHADRVTGAMVTRHALKTLNAKRDGPLFMVVHYADPHAPYRTHEAFPPASDALADLYRAEVSYTDAEFGRLMRALEEAGRMEDTMIVVFSDHGENLGDHGDAGGHHGVSLYDEVLRVPLGVYLPGVESGVVDDPVSVVDITPTILELIRARGLKRADGRSLAGYLFGAPPKPAPTISEFYDFSHRLQAIVDGRYKLIYDMQHNAQLLFDVIADPEELEDLARSHPEEAARLRRTLDVWVETWGDSAQPKPEACGS